MSGRKVHDKTSILRQVEHSGGCVTRKTRIVDVSLAGVLSDQGFRSRRIMLKCAEKLRIITNATPMPIHIA